MVGDSDSVLISCTWRHAKYLTERGSWVLRLSFKNEWNKLMSCRQQIQIRTSWFLVTNVSLRVPIYCLTIPSPIIEVT